MILRVRNEQEQNLTQEITHHKIQTTLVQKSRRVAANSRNRIWAKLDSTSRLKNSPTSRNVGPRDYRERKLYNGGERIFETPENGGCGGWRRRRVDPVRKFGEKSRKDPSNLLPSSTEPEGAQFPFSPRRGSTRVPKSGAYRHR
ncbi:hypothetical protein L6164_026426 [Bauhinia variegata]|uniref:Uncharacterized protein n=1 Tax=Bauhinia variegata TaxID=167791 RepID=A0ACB9LRM5_BAUVA|nr:hypothetical protein L6164_026426 [Bauhinia variegata]